MNSVQTTDYDIFSPPTEQDPYDDSPPAQTVPKENPTESKNMRPEPNPFTVENKQPNPMLETPRYCKHCGKAV